MSTTFDTLTAARALEAAGIERRQAKAIACTIRSAAARETLATKADLADEAAAESPAPKGMRSPESLSASFRFR